MKINRFSADSRWYIRKSCRGNSNTSYGRDSSGLIYNAVPRSSAGDFSLSQSASFWGYEYDRKED